MAATSEHPKDSTPCSGDFSDYDSLSDERRHAPDKNKPPQKFREKTSEIGVRIQDRLADKLLRITNLMEGIPHKPDLFQESVPPNLSIPTMSNNFRRFNARVGIVFIIQKKIVNLLSWDTPSHTLSFLAIYTLICLDPYIITVLPPVLLLASLLPSYTARHPDPKIKANKYQDPIIEGFIPSVRAVKEHPKYFLRNLRDLQNTMDDLSRVHDQIEGLVVPLINFSNEKLSSTIFIFSFMFALLMCVTSHLLPWRLMFLFMGWTLVCTSHPTIQRRVLYIAKAYLVPLEAKAKARFDCWISQEIILDLTETREVEIFEIQHFSAGEWKTWLFSSVPFHPMSDVHLNSESPLGTRFFEEVQPPPGWEWGEKKWDLDVWSQDWVEHRVTSGVEIETEGEGWVYDLRQDNESCGMDIEERVDALNEKGLPNPLSVSEAADVVIAERKRRGDWRRRRWVRLVKSKCPNATSSTIDPRD